MDILLKISNLHGPDKELHYTLNYLLSNDYLNLAETILITGLVCDNSATIPT